ncbi:hypothetical protein M422DRAFT_269220 [Sphaerobolus stellatus SS14]|uniref:Uncharacterized protein n=1 Tax=Sphaerobolus stellatus (strain SS14) TaxID=990650 RepID=A0A0C9TIM4_SPHS4|nr:hypothetical protein M422DRAFT_269220 [Sphaerobolus stellatus SS14]
MALRTCPWVTRSTVAALTRPSKEENEPFCTLTKREKSQIYTRYKLPSFFSYLDFSAFQDGHLWNLATVHDICADFARVEHKYRCVSHPRYHLKDFPDAEYVLWLIQPYKDFPDYNAGDYKTIPDTYSEEVHEHLNFYHDLTQIIKPHGKEIMLSIPVCYYGLLVALNCQIFNLETPSLNPESKSVELQHILQHKLSYCYGLREMFSYEVILAHILGEMTADWRSKTLNDYAHWLASVRHLRKYPNAGQLSVHNASDRAIFNDVYKEIGYDTDLNENDWVTIHKNAVHVIQNEFGNNDGFFWEPIIMQTSPHTTMHYVHGVELVKIEEDGNIPEPDSEWIEGDREELTEEEHNIVLVGALEEKKKKKTTKEKDLAQQELARGVHHHLQLEVQIQQ